ncbi:signal transduction histidine kinase [Homoserinimonas aerilata]|uniref:Signal transduction histidine kinase n=2 Tax=Homoserinimonas aerilata TaxID=1162970 RepID=A0A542YGT8_9MICO|nr:signal transduction histidine kinase [Homoserinimonas aerilata]
MRLDATIRAGWALAATALVILAALTISRMVDAGRGAELALPLLAIAAVLAALWVLIRAPSTLTGVLFLTVGASAMLVHAHSVAAAGLDVDSYAAGGIVVALCLIGPATGRELGAMAWNAAGYLTGQGTLLLGEALSGQPLRFNSLATVVFICFSCVLLIMKRTRRIEARILPEDDTVEAEFERHEEERRQSNRAAVIVHETILSDLALVAHGSVQLGEAERARLRRNLELVGRARVDHSHHTAVVAMLRNDLYEIVSEFQWRGLTIDIGGDSSCLELLSLPEREALMGAIRAALENVRAHSGEDSVEIFIDQAIDRLTVMIVDEGRGFEFEKIADDRLGLRMSIIRRIEDCGGSVTVWSAHGAGTSVVISLPVGDAGDVIVVGTETPAAPQARTTENGSDARA